LATGFYDWQIEKIENGVSRFHYRRNYDVVRLLLLNSPDHMLGCKFGDNEIPLDTVSLFETLNGTV
jgi:hypothetical protein